MRIKIAFLLLVVLGVGTACAGEPTPAPSTDGTATSPAAIEPPLPALPLECGDVVSSATLAAFAGAEIPVSTDALEVPNSWYEVVKRQGQMLTCEWAADRDVVSLSVLAVPRAAADFAAYRAGLVPNAYNQFDAAGDESVHQCAYGQCRFDLLVGEFWIGGFANNPPVMDETDLEPLFLPILTEIAAAAEGALAEQRDPWVEPTEVLGGWGAECGEQAPVGALATALGASGARARTLFEGDAGIWGLVSERNAVSTCTFVDPATDSPIGGVTVVEAGGWVADEWSIQPPAQWDSGFYEPVEVGGIGVIYLGDEGSQWDAYIPFEGSLISVWTVGDTREGFLAKISSVATAVSL